MPLRLCFPVLAPHEAVDLSIETGASGRELPAPGVSSQGALPGRVDSGGGRRERLVFSPEPGLGGAWQCPVVGLSWWALPVAEKLAERIPHPYSHTIQLLNPSFCPQFFLRYCWKLLVWLSHVGGGGRGRRDGWNLGERL